MRRVLPVLLALCMTVFFCVPSGYVQAEDGLLITVSHETGKPGDTVVVTVTLDRNPGFCYMRLTAAYDEEVFTQVKVQNGDVAETFTAAKSFLLETEADTTATGILLTVVFTIREDAAPGEYPVEIECRECYNNALDDIKASVISAVITVVSDVESAPTEPPSKPEDQNPENQKPEVPDTGNADMTVLTAALAAVAGLGALILVVGQKHRT